MKRITASVLLFYIILSSYAQEVAQVVQKPVSATSSPEATFPGALPAAKAPASAAQKRRDAGAAFCILGGALIIAGLVVWSDGSSQSGILPIPQDDTHAQEGAILFGVGLGMFIPGTIALVRGNRQMKGLPSKNATPITSLAQVSTTPVTDITATSAVSGGNVTSDGGFSVTERGVCWSTHATPTISDIKTSDGSGGGAFTSQVSGLSAGTSYFIRSYAVTSNGISYGLSYSFTTPKP